jgi:hypothetical protein
MRLNESTYPAYAVLESNNLEYLKVDKMIHGMLGTEEKFLTFLSSLKFVFAQVAKKYYLTSTFKSAINTALPKIIQDDKQFNDAPCDCGIIFTEKGFSLFLSNPTDKKLKLLCFGFTRDILTTYGYVDNDGNFGGMAASIKDGKPYNDLAALNMYLNTFMVSLYFIHNCDIEQKVLEPKAKCVQSGEKHYNESNSDLIILDCRWFTELIRNTPFHVKGHLRWQAHGENRNKRKLIFISDFEKQGYRSKSKKSE